MTAMDGGNAKQLSGTILAIHVGKKKQIQIYLLNTAICRAAIKAP
jgi:hypothetical protein